MYIKDMERLGRNISDVILLDNSPISYIFQPENGMPIKNWYDDKHDTDLTQYAGVLKMMTEVDDVRKFLPKMHGF
jgi:carboxy-terminal domain RNA polymerase II polypeptide A small phosphatase